MWGEQDTETKALVTKFPSFTALFSVSPSHLVVHKHNYSWTSRDTCGSHACNIVGVLRPPHADPCRWRLCPWRGTKCPGIFPPAYCLNGLRWLLGPAGRSQAKCAELGERLPLCLQYGKSRRNCRQDQGNLILPKTSKPYSDGMPNTHDIM